MSHICILVTFIALRIVCSVANADVWFNVTRCPFTQGGWAIRAEILSCDADKQLIYHCLLDQTGNSIEACMPQKRFNDDCPWVYIDSDGNLFHANKRTRCKDVTYCPDPRETHLTNQLFKYQACLVEESKRANFTPSDYWTFLTDTDDPSLRKGQLVKSDSASKIAGGVIGGGGVVFAICVCTIRFRRRIVAFFNRITGRERKWSLLLPNNTSTDVSVFNIKSRGVEERPSYSKRDVTEPSSENRGVRTIEETTISGDDSFTQLLQENKGTATRCLKDQFVTALGKRRNMSQGVHQFVNDKREHITGYFIMDVLPHVIQVGDFPEIVNPLLEINPNIIFDDVKLKPLANSRFNKHVSLLILAATSKRYKTVINLLKKYPGISLTDEDSFGNTVLHYAAFFNWKDVAHCVLKRELDIIDQYNYVGKTALMVAMSCRHEHISIMLIQNGGIVEDQYKDQTPFLNLCLKHQWDKVVMLFLVREKESMKDKTAEDTNYLYEKVAGMAKHLMTPFKRSSRPFLDHIRYIFPDVYSKKLIIFENKNVLTWAVHNGNLQALEYILTTYEHGDILDETDKKALMDQCKACEKGRKHEDQTDQSVKYEGGGVNINVV